MDSSMLRGLRSGSAILALTWAAACPAEPLLSAERPTPKIGDTAIFRNLNVATGEKRDTSIVVIVIDADKIVNEASGSTSGTRTYTRDYNLLEVKTGEKVTFTVKPFWASLRFPLEIGQMWDGSFESEAVVRPRNRSAQWRWKANVVAAEAVTVPAGTFQTFKVEYDGRYFAHQGGQSWTGSRKETAWFAPDIDSFIKREFEDRSPARNLLDHHLIELLSFKPAP